MIIFILIKCLSQLVERNSLVSGGWYGIRVGQKLALVAESAQLLPVQPGKHSTAPVVGLQV